jgi:hypothetical protein
VSAAAGRVSSGAVAAVFGGRTRGCAGAQARARVGAGAREGAGGVARIGRGGSTSDGSGERRSAHNCFRPSKKNLSGRQSRRGWTSARVAATPRIARVASRAAPCRLVRACGEAGLMPAPTGPATPSFA